MKQFIVFKWVVYLWYVADTSRYIPNNLIQLIMLGSQKKQTKKTL